MTTYYAKFTAAEIDEKFRALSQAELDDSDEPMTLVELRSTIDKATFKWLAECGIIIDNSGDVIVHSFDSIKQSEQRANEILSDDASSDCMLNGADAAISLTCIIRAANGQSFDEIYGQ